MKITVIGAQKSGVAAARLARRKGADVFVTEINEPDKYNIAIELFKELGVGYEFGGHTARALECDLIVASPGVRPSNEIIKTAEGRGIKIISELEYASQFITNPICAITGTNGKTTVTSLIEYILNNSGKKAYACGNIGAPLSDFVDKIEPEAILVCEVSSFQLDRVEKFRPQVAVILNITPDHLYYHGTMEEYAAAKWKINCNQNEKNLLILNNDDPLLGESLVETKANIMRFSMSRVDWGIYPENGSIIIANGNRQKEETLMKTCELALPGAHNLYNSMAAALAARAFEVRNEDIRDSLMSFKGVEHRLEHVRTLHGVDYVNDSKATNINATWYALSSYSKPIVWLAGGRGDSNNYAELDKFVAENVKAIVAIGEERDAIFNHFCASVRCVKADTLEEAVIRCAELAEEGDVALFSPACKSFDMFANYEHRGACFKEIVNSLD